jgi:hypothetical protein
MAAAAVFSGYVDPGTELATRRKIISTSDYDRSIYPEGQIEGSVLSLYLEHVPSHDLNKHVKKFENVEVLSIDSLEGDLIEEIEKISNLQKLYISGPISVTSLEYLR